MTAPLLQPTANNVDFTGITRTSTNIAIPTAGAPTFVAITNLGDRTVYVRLGNSSVTVDETGIPVLPHNVVYLSLSSNTYLAALSFYGTGAISITPST